MRSIEPVRYGPGLDRSTKSQVMITPTATINNNPLAQKANEVVNMVFWGAMLREFRQSHPPTMFEGGRAGGVFMRQLDMEVVRRISKSGSTPVADVLIKRLDQQGRHQLGRMLGGAIGSLRGAQGAIGDTAVSYRQENR